MQSSTAVTCRALVMLVCLIGIPLVALFGTALPDMAKSLLEGRWGRSLASERDSLGEAPPFVPASGSAALGVALRSGAGWPSAAVDPPVSGVAAIAVTTPEPSFAALFAGTTRAAASAFASMAAST